MLGTLKGMEIEPKIWSLTPTPVHYEIFGVTSSGMIYV